MLRKLSRSHRACPVECHKDNDTLDGIKDIFADLENHGVDISISPFFGTVKLQIFIYTGGMLDRTFNSMMKNKIKRIAFGLKNHGNNILNDPLTSEQYCKRLREIIYEINLCKQKIF